MSVLSIADSNKDNEQKEMYALKLEELAKSIRSAATAPRACLILCMYERECAVFQKFDEQFDRTRLIGVLATVEHNLIHMGTVEPLNVPSM